MLLIFMFKTFRCGNAVLRKARCCGERVNLAAVDRPLAWCRPRGTQHPQPPSAWPIRTIKAVSSETRIHFGALPEKAHHCVRGSNDGLVPVSEDGEDLRRRTITYLKRGAGTRLVDYESPDGASMRISTWTRGNPKRNVIFRAVKVPTIGYSRAHPHYTRTILPALGGGKSELNLRAV